MFACAQIYRRFSTSQVNGCDVGSLRMVNCHVSWGQWLEFSYWISYPLFICGRNLIIFMWIQANIMKIDWKKCLWNIYVIDDIYGLSDKQIIATQVIVMIQYDMIYPLGNNFLPDVSEYNLLLLKLTKIRPFCLHVGFFIEMHSLLCWGFGSCCRKATKFAVVFLAWDQLVN